MCWSDGEREHDFLWVTGELGMILTRSGALSRRSKSCGASGRDSFSPLRHFHHGKETVRPNHCADTSTEHVYEHYYYGTYYTHAYTSEKLFLDIVNNVQQDSEKIDQVFFRGASTIKYRWRAARLTRW